jgi:gluconate 2-dehydrogenase alpha chain
MTTIKAYFDKDVYTNPFIGAGGNGVVLTTSTPITSIMPKKASSAARRCGSTRRGPSRLPACPTRRARQPGVASGKRHRRLLHPPCVDGCSRCASVLPWQLPGSRPGLSRCLRPALAAHDIRLAGKRHQDEPFMYEKMGKIAKAMNPKADRLLGKKVGDHFNTASYQTTHL